MLTPNEINPIQLPRVIDLQREVIEELARKTGRRFTPRSRLVQNRVLRRILKEGSTWRTEIEASWPWCRLNPRCPQQKAECAVTVNRLRG